MPFKLVNQLSTLVAGPYMTGFITGMVFVIAVIEMTLFWIIALVAMAGVQITKSIQE